MNWEKEVEKIEDNLYPLTSKYTEEIIEKSKGAEKKCFTVAKDDADKFVNCMLPLMKKFSKHEANLEYTLAFNRVRGYECLERSGGEPLTMEECKVRFTENVKKYYENFIKQL